VVDLHRLTPWQVVFSGHDYLEELTVKLYCRIDLHSNNHYLTLIDELDRRILEKRLRNDLSVTLKTLEPYRAEVTGIAVESTFKKALPGVHWQSTAHLRVTSPLCPCFFIAS
jgi:hypothetical protein